MSDEIINNRNSQRFELNVEGLTAVSCYQLSPGVIRFTHVKVPKELEGRGIGSKLVKGTLEVARREGLKVIPDCPFVRAYIKKHSEYADMLA